MLNVRPRRAFEHTRSRGGWDCPFASTWHRAHPLLTVRAKLLTIVDVVVWDFWMVTNGLSISRQDKTYFHSFFVYLRHVRQERDWMSPCKPAGRSTPKRHSPTLHKCLALPVVVGCSKLDRISRAEGETTGLWGSTVLPWAGLPRL